MTATTTAHTPDRTSVLSRKWGGLLVLLGMVALVVHRITSEMALMHEYGSDPQMGIWFMFLVAKLLYWFVGGAVAVGVLFFAWKPRWRIMLGVVLLLGWGYGIHMETWKIQLKQQALAESRDPSTSPKRLEQLLQFPDNMGGYELDNRIAANPHSPPELLRELYYRQNSGTLMILARRPDTPEDVLQAMVDHDLATVGRDLENEWIRKSLKRNPKLPDAIRRKLDEHQPSVIK